MGRPFGTEKRTEGAGPKSRNRLLKVVGSCSRIGCLKENVPGNFCPQPDSNLWGGTFAPGIGRRGQGEGSGAQREGGVIYESSGLPVTYPPQQGALPGEKRRKGHYLFSIQSSATHNQDFVVR